MASVSDYMFNNLGRIGSDKIDESQKAVHNVRYANRMMADYFSDRGSNHTVQFAASYPGMNFSGIAHGNGTNAAVVDDSSKLFNGMKQSRPAEPQQLHQRIYATVPYMGRGAGNPDVESRLRTGRSVFVPKGESTVTSKSFADVALYPVDREMKKRVEDPSNTVEEAALEGWVRGGANTRESGSDPRIKK